MGSLFKVSVRYILKNELKEKEFLDELRKRNSNLDIQLIPYLSNSEGL